jgi:hypothetical protein
VAGMNSSEQKGPFDLGRFDTAALPASFLAKITVGKLSRTYRHGESVFFQGDVGDLPVPVFYFDQTWGRVGPTMDA